MNSMYKLISVLYLLLLTFNSYAYSQQRLFVSKINVEGNVRITNSQWNSLNEELTIAIGNNIDSKEYILLSSESITELLSPGTKLEDCIGKCIVKVGREVQAHISVHGNLRQVNDAYYLYLTATKMSNAEILEKTSIKFNLFTEAFSKLKKIKLLKPKSKFDIEEFDKKIQSKLFEIKQCSVSLWKRNMYKNTISFFVFVHKKGLILKGEYELENSERESYCLTNILNTISIDPFENDNDIFKKLFIFKIDKDWKEHREYLKSIDEYEGLNERGVKIVPKSKRYHYNRQSVFERGIIIAGLNNRNLNYDSDGDGILDHRDKCPQRPEDYDGDEDEDGCPDLNKKNKASRRLNRAEKARLETLRDAKAMAKEAREAAEASTVDFNKRGRNKSRFSRQAFDQALSTRSSRLMKCIEAEVTRSPNTEVLKVTITVQQTGRFLNARLANGSGPGVKCVFRAIRGLKMEPFAGGDKTITLPYKVKN